MSTCWVGTGCMASTTVKVTFSSRKRAETCRGPLVRQTLAVNPLMARLAYLVAPECVIGDVDDIAVGLQGSCQQLCQPGPS